MSDPEGTVRRFADWLWEISPYYRALRTDVRVHPGAPARLGQFWHAVGWVPGVGTSSVFDKPPQRPERHLGQAAADKAIRRWLGRECFAPALGLGAATGQAVWDRLPRSCWVHKIVTDPPLACHGGYLYYVDEDAGDDPPMMLWDSHATGWECRKGDREPPQPGEIDASAVAYLMRATIAELVGYSSQIRMPVPRTAGPFAPVYSAFWELGPGVWGVPYTYAGPDDPTTIGLAIYQSPRAYLEHLIGLPTGSLPAYAGGGFFVEGAHQILVEDAKALAPGRLAERGFGYVEHDGAPKAVGRIDGMPVTVQSFVKDGRPAGDQFHVLPEDYAAFRQLLKREKIKAYEHLSPRRVVTAGEPTEAERAAVARLAARAWDEPTAAKPPARRRSARVVDVDPAEEAAVRAEAAGIRRWLTAVHPGLELTPPGLAMDDPPLVRAMWEELGFDEELHKVVGWPDRASSKAELARVLDDYRSWESPLRRRALPTRCRLVEVDDQGCGLAVTDEDTPCADPRIVAGSADTGTVSELHPSYLAWVGERLAEFAAEGGAGCVVRTEPPVGALGEQPYPRLVAGIRRLAPGVWGSARLPDRWYLGAPSFRDLVAWLATTDTPRRLALEDDHRSPRPAARIPLQAFRPVPGLREWRAPDGGQRCYAGTLGDVAMLVNVTPLAATLIVAPGQREQGEALAAAHGWVAAPTGSGRALDGHDDGQDPVPGRRPDQPG